MNRNQVDQKKALFVIMRRVYRKLERTLLTLKKDYYLARYNNRKSFEVAILDKKIRLSLEDPYSRDWIIERFAGGKIHEKPVTFMMLDAVRASICFVDGGANLGWYTCVAGAFMPGGLVYSFEMDDLNVELLRKNVAANHFSNVSVYHAALADAPGTVSYRRHEIGPNPANSLASGVTQRGMKDVITVQSIALDAFFADKEIKPDLIKIDVEGAETQVLRGMTGLLNKGDPKLFIEIHPRALKELHSSVDEVLSILKEHGFDVFIIEHMRRQGNAQLKTLSDLSPVLSANEQTMLYACKDRQQEKRVMPVRTLAFL